MKLEYNLGRYSLKVLNHNNSIDVLDFYYRNRRTLISMSLTNQLLFTPKAL